MTSGAQELLSVLSLLPDGLSDAELVQRTLPISNMFACKSVLLRTSLAFKGNNKRLKLLVPIREYISRVHPPSTTLKLSLQQHFYQILDIWNSFKNDLPSADMIPHITSNLGNLNYVLSDALGVHNSDSIQVLRCVLSLNDFYEYTNKSFSPFLQRLSEEITTRQDDPIYGTFLIAMIRTSSLLPTLHFEDQIALGIQYFESADTLEQGHLMGANVVVTYQTYSGFKQTG
ncbi:hypothetical protein B0H10DRAFT_2433508 [Mycena sp. CBHHK59/15]|nr:hypothetical protein B0H10DRAFT_2433508 [Mycena sp. CBHHK59/15]